MDQLKVKCVVEEITALLEACGCYKRRDDAVRTQIPEYGPGYRCKIDLSGSSEQRGFEFFHVVVESPVGAVQKIRLSAEANLGIVTATNMKQRPRNSTSISLPAE